MNATEPKTDVRAQFHELFGYSDTDLREYGEYTDQAEELSIGADDCVMWIPDSVSLPLGIPVAEFTSVENMAYATADTSDSDDIEDNQVELIICESDGREHAVQLKYVARLAHLADTSVKRLCDRARIHTDYANYPPMIPMDRGRVLISPFLGEYERING